jgi:hypothetical protein
MTWSHLTSSQSDDKSISPHIISVYFVLSWKIFNSFERIRFLFFPWEWNEFFLTDFISRGSTFCSERVILTHSLTRVFVSLLICSSSNCQRNLLFRAGLYIGSRNKTDCLEEDQTHQRIPPIRKLSETAETILRATVTPFDKAESYFKTKSDFEILSILW